MLIVPLLRTAFNTTCARRSENRGGGRVFRPSRPGADLFFDAVMLAALSTNANSGNRATC